MRDVSRTMQSETSSAARQPTVSDLQKHAAHVLHMFLMLPVTVQVQEGSCLVILRQHVMLKLGPEPAQD